MVKLLMNSSDKGKQTIQGPPAEAALWEIMVKALGSNSLMGCSALGDTEGEIPYPEGIPSGCLAGHAYAIIDAFEINVNLLVQNKDGKEEMVAKDVKLVRLRNPWGMLLLIILIFFRKEGMEWSLER